jgi:hypothetical protein
MKTIIHKIKFTKETVLNCRKCRIGEIIALGRYGLTLKQAQFLISEGVALPYSVKLKSFVATAAIKEKGD